MLLLRMSEVEAQISTNEVEIKENQGLPSGHSRPEESRFALGWGICAEARQAELGPHYWVAASLSLCICWETIGIDFLIYKISKLLSKTYCNKIHCTWYTSVFAFLIRYVSVFLYLYVIPVYIDRRKKKGGNT